MSPQTAQDLANGITKASVSGGFVSSALAFVNVNAAGLGVLVSLLGVVIASCFHFIALKKKDSNTKRIKELEEQLKSINDRKSGK